MKSKIMIALLPLALIGCQTPSDQNRAVVTYWKTHWNNGNGSGIMQLHQQDTVVRGSYNPQDKGAIFGQMQGKTLTGYWIEDRSNKRCSTAMEGRYYWGRVQLTFNRDQFQGSWGYCDEALTRPWTGKLNQN